MDTWINVLQFIVEVTENWSCEGLMTATDISILLRSPWH